MKDINFFSNPELMFKGVPTGKKGVANAARVFREHRFAIAAIGDESENCGSSSDSSIHRFLKGHFCHHRFGEREIQSESPRDSL